MNPYYAYTKPLCVIRKTEEHLMKYSLIIITFYLLISCQTNGQKKQNNDSDLSLRIDLIISGQKFNGVILVSVDSTDIYSKAIGFSDLENETKLDLNDQFVIGSISKQITAVLVLREYEKGNLELDDSWKILNPNKSALDKRSNHSSFVDSHTRNC